MKIKKGDQVIVTTGRDKGKQGEVLRAMPKTETGKATRVGFKVVDGEKVRVAKKSGKVIAAK